MPTFTAIALDPLLETGASKSMSGVNDVPNPRLERRNSTSSSRRDNNKGNEVPPLRLLEKRSSLPSWKGERINNPQATSANRNNHWTQISPALYVTPEPTPLPDSPSSFPPSPYVINHKRRGPRLLKSLSEVDVGQKEGENAGNSENKVGSRDAGSILKDTVNSEKDKQLIPGNRSPVEGLRIDGTTSVDIKDSGNAENLGEADHDHGSPVQEESVSGTSHCVKEEHLDTDSTSSHDEENMHVNNTLDKQQQADGSCNGEFQSCQMASSSAEPKDTGKTVVFNLQQTDGLEDSSGPQDSESVRNKTEVTVKGGFEGSMSLTIPAAEFYDAWEELSSENGPHPPVPDIEAELREIRLSLLMEIEKRKQAEEASSNMQTQWLRIRSQLSSVGLRLPANVLAVTKNEQLEDPGEDLTEQVYVARFVANSIGRGQAKAEAEIEMEAELESKNFEITRLWDKLHYYEAVNQEMSHRNQEAIDTARRLRQQRKRRQKWLWGSIATAITLGSAVLAWSYRSTGKGTSSANQSQGSLGDHASRK